MTSHLGRKIEITDSHELIETKEAVDLRDSGDVCGVGAKRTRISPTAVTLFS